MKKIIDCLLKLISYNAYFSIWPKTNYRKFIPKNTSLKNTLERFESYFLRK